MLDLIFDNPVAPFEPVEVEFANSSAESFAIFTNSTASS
jgi:hypothetical protein